MSTNLTFEQALKRKNYAKSKFLLTHFKAYNGGKTPQWNNLTKLFIIEFVRYIKGKLSPNSARTYCAYIKSFLNDYKEAVNIPCESKEYAKILSLRKVDCKHIYLTDEEIKLLINYHPENEKEHTVRNQFLLSCLTGMRHSDAIKIDLNNLDEGIIYFLTQKTQSLTSVYSCELIVELLNQGMNKTYDHKTFNSTIQEICKKVGITQPAMIIKAGKKETGKKYEFVSSHTARRSFATNMYKETKDIYTVSRLMGHRSIMITETYICIDIYENDNVKEYYGKYNNKSELAS